MRVALAAADVRLERAFHRLDAMRPAFALLLLAAACLGANVALAVLVGLPIREIGIDPRQVRLEGLVERGFAWVLLVVVVVAPLIETWLLQALPLWVARHWTARPAPAILAAAAAFAAAHALFSHLSHGLTQIGGGAVLAFTFFWASRRPPVPRPVLATWAVHAANNLAVVAFLFWAAGAAATPR